MILIALSKHSVNISI